MSCEGPGRASGLLGQASLQAENTRLQISRRKKKKKTENNGHESLNFVSFSCIVGYSSSWSSLTPFENAEATSPSGCRVLTAGLGAAGFAPPATPLGAGVTGEPFLVTERTRWWDRTGVRPSPPPLSPILSPSHLFLSSFPLSSLRLPLSPSLCLSLHLRFPVHPRLRESRERVATATEVAKRHGRLTHPLGPVAGPGGRASG